MPIKRKFIPDARSVLGLLVPAALLLAVLPMGERRAWGDNPVPTQPESIPALQVRYRLTVPGGGEIFPALTSIAPADYWPIATLTMVNISSQPLVETVWAEVHNW
ncbi:MAG: hypothetical protein P4N24_08505, partial [Acidobacteriota bacterium]|nr:hypothetical protein [Acidobacteriota bacterium]